MTDQPTPPQTPATPRRARKFSYYDDWKSTTLECWRCGWKGTFNEGLVELFEQLMDSTCPNCRDDAPMLAIVMHPTTEESRENWSKLGPVDQAAVEAREAFVRYLEEASLKSPDQLPDIEGPELVLVWDFVRRTDEVSETVLRHGGAEIWREPAVFEGSDRFTEILSILREKYGDRVKDMVPTEDSLLNLYGDSLVASGRVARARASLRPPGGGS